MFIQACVILTRTQIYTDRKVASLGDPSSSFRFLLLSKEYI